MLSYNLIFKNDNNEVELKHLLADEDEEALFKARSILKSNSYIEPLLFRVCTSCHCKTLIYDFDKEIFYE